MRLRPNKHFSNHNVTWKGEQGMHHPGEFMLLPWKSYQIPEETVVMRRKALTERTAKASG